MWFIFVNRIEIKNNNLHVTGQKLMKIMGKMWKKKNKEQQSFYYTLSSNDKHRFNRELKEYNK